jgi:Acyl-CoA thioesterase N-terminal domain/Acyl-CoA thioesterase C-terminal domain
VRVTDFDDATAVEATGEGSYAWLLPDGWQQGRGAWGGLVVAALVRSIVASEPDPRRLVRSVSVQMMAPAMPGPHVIETRAARRGSAISTWSAVLTDAQGAEVASMAAVTGGPRAPVQTHGSRGWGTVAAPVVPPVDSLDRAPTGPPFPVFMQHLDFRPVSGMPFSGGPAASIGWLGLLQPPTPSEVTLLALGDAWWPASLPMLAQMPRVATVSFMANLLLDPTTVPAGELLLHESFVTAAADGFASEHRRLWTSDGRLAVDNLQTMVIGA